MIPIEKNIIVVDDNGNEYEATYPKRAKGLVKNGRARFVGENKICLVCPPNKFDTEDIKMSENIINTEAIAEELNNTPAQAEAQLTPEYILSELAKIRAQTEYINKAIDAINDFSCDSVEFLKTAVDGFVEAIRIRETTNQELIHLYGKMLDKLIPNNDPASDRQSIIAQITAFAANANSIDEVERVLSRLEDILPTSDSCEVEAARWEAISSLLSDARHTGMLASEGASVLETVRMMIQK